jgi:hypothetical protein
MLASSWLGEAEAIELSFGARDSTNRQHDGICSLLHFSFVFAVTRGVSLRPLASSKNVRSSSGVSLLCLKMYMLCENVCYLLVS